MREALTDLLLYNVLRDIFAGKWSGVHEILICKVPPVVPVSEDNQSRGQTSRFVTLSW